MNRAGKRAGLILVGGLLLSSHLALSCRCGTKPPVQEALAHSEHVFLGVVTALEATQVSLSVGSQPRELVPAFRIAFRVGRRWKGAASPEIVLYAISNCAFPFELGRSYLVFAHPSLAGSAYLEATICLPTALRANAAESIRALGPPLKRQPAASTAT